MLANFPNPAEALELARSGARPVRPPGLGRAPGGDLDSEALLRTVDAPGRELGRDEVPERRVPGRAEATPGNRAGVEVGEAGSEAVGVD